MLTIRPSAARGGGDHGWLRSRHTFSFADYHDPKHMGFGPLRVINEDWIKAGTGFGAHPHRDMEIITYVVAGSLAHQDSLGNQTVIRPNEVQRMTAGSGIVHSEVNPETEGETHLFQIWIRPETSGLTPGYGQKSFLEPLNRGEPVLVISHDGREGSIPIHQDVDMYILRVQEQGRRRFELNLRQAAWIQVIAGPVTVNGQALATGDGAATTDQRLELVANPGSELLVFDLNAH